MKKPKYVYHASPNRNIEEFEPRKRTSRDPNEPPAIFAAPRKDIAVSFITPTDDSWVGGGSFHPKKETWYIVISDKERYLREDKGGAIYTLPSDTFSVDPNKGLGLYEWASYVPVKPIDKEEHSSTLEAMLGFGVQVYFVDKETYERIRNSKDHGLSILQRLTSVNQERVINIKPLT